MYICSLFFKWQFAKNPNYWVELNWIQFNSQIAYNLRIYEFVNLGLLSIYFPQKIDIQMKNWKSTPKYSKKVSTRVQVLKYLVLRSTKYSKYSSTRYFFSKFTLNTQALDTFFLNLLQVLKYRYSSFEYLE